MNKLILKMNARYAYNNCSDEEEESDIINNNDDFGTVSELQKPVYNPDSYNIPKQKQNENYCYVEKLNSPSENIHNPVQKKQYFLDEENNNNENFIDNNNLNKTERQKIHQKNEDEEKTIFSKITEDLYKDYIYHIGIGPNKNISDINKEKEDNYNKLTVEKYLFTCADKENSKNRNIINKFIERKEKEQTCKKIGIDLDKKYGTQLKDLKRASSDNKCRKKAKSRRSPLQFLDDQKNLEEKQKNNLKRLIKLHNDKINENIKDRPTITEESKKIARNIINKNNNTINKDIHLKLYEQFNNKKKSLEEQEKKNNIILSNKNYTSCNKKITNDAIMENAKRLYKEYETKNKKIREIETKKLQKIKNLSGTSLISKNSNAIIINHFINKYKTVLSRCFNKKITDDFDLSFIEYLSLLLKLGFISKNYSNLVQEENNNEKKNDENLKNSLPTKKNNSLTNRQENQKDENLQKSKENKIVRSNSKTSLNNNNNHYSTARSVSINKKNELDFHSEIEYKLSNSAWKIITKTNEFNKNLLANSKRLLLFFLSLMGIYKGDEVFLKKEFQFLIEENNKENTTINNEVIDAHLANHIYKYFCVYRNNVINNLFLKNKIKNNKQISNDYCPCLCKNSRSFICNNDYNENHEINNNNDINANYDEENNIYKDRNSQRSMNHIDKRSNKDLNKNINNKSKGKFSTNNYTAISHTYTNINKPNIYIKDNSKNAKILYKNNNYYNTKNNTGSNSIGAIKRKVLLESKKNLKQNSLKPEKINNETEKYIFNEDYRIKEDIASNHNNYNNNEISDSNSAKNKRKVSEAEEKKTKLKFVFKIQIKDNLEKLIINRGDDIENKVDEFCKEFNLDSEDKQQILDVVCKKLRI